MKQSMKSEKSGGRSAPKSELNKRGDKGFVHPKAKPHVQGRHCGALCNLNLIDLPVQAKARPNLTSMPDKLKAGIEALSGIDISDVRVHHNSKKPMQLDALAYAQGRDIHLAPGQERYLSHEAWHLVQQRQGRVRPTLQTEGMAINDDPILEHEASRMGEKASIFSVEGPAAGGMISSNAPLLFGGLQATSQPPLQRMDNPDKEKKQHADLGASHSKKRSGRIESHHPGKGQQVDPAKSRAKDRQRQRKLDAMVENSKKNRDPKAEK